jgi:hypothetical protein
LPLFSLEVFVLSPLCFGVASFSSEVFVLSPLCFGVAYFFIAGLYFERLAFWVVCFFIRGHCFEPTNEGCNNAPSFVALASLAQQLLSNTELAVLAILMMVITF